MAAMRSAQEASDRRTGLLFLVITSVGWGVNWPAMKVLLLEWPPLFSRGLAGIVAAAGLAALALARNESLVVPRDAWPRLIASSAINVTAWMGLSSVAMQWLSAGEGALVLYTMPIWATLFAWPVLGERPTPQRILALAMGIAGIALLFAGQPLARDTDKLLGIAFMLTAGVLFAFGTVTLRRPLSLSPICTSRFCRRLASICSICCASAWRPCSERRCTSLSSSSISRSLSAVCS